jgi:hypothetical protein
MFIYAYNLCRYYNGTPFESNGYVVLIGSLSAASTFTGIYMNIDRHDYICLYYAIYLYIYKCINT